MTQQERTSNPAPVSQTTAFAYGDDRHVRAVTALAEAGIPVDVQELLIYGNASQGIPPNALQKALEAVSSQPPSPQMTGGLSDDDRAKAWREAFDAMHQRAMRAEKIIRDNWLGGYWRAVDYRQANEVRIILADTPPQTNVPAGWKLVPIDPTPEMVEAGRIAAMNVQGGYDGPSRWEAMLSAAPTPPQEREGQP